MLLHSNRVDNQLKDILTARLSKSLDDAAYYGFSSDFRPECLATVELIYNGLSVFLGSPSPGMKCMDLKIAKDSGKPYRLVLGIIAKWIHRRALKFAVSRGWRDYPESHRLKILWNYLQFLDLTGKLLNLLVYMEFLYSGVYPDALYRMTGYQMTFVSTGSSVNSSLRLVRQREIALQVLSSLAVSSSLSMQWLRICWRFAFKRLYAIRNNILAYAKSSTTYLPSTIPPMSSNLSQGCGHCGSFPIESPHTAACGHIYCYYCLAMELADSHGGSYMCRICGAIGSSCTPYST